MKKIFSGKIMKKEILIFLLIISVMVLSCPIAFSAKAMTASRNDGIWLFPLSSSKYNSFSDWAACPGGDKCVLCGVYHSGWGDSYHSGQGGHNGLDISAAVNTDVYAAAPGKIVHAASMGARGNTIIVEHSIGNGYSYYSYYQHLNSFTKTSGSVSAGTIIGKVGNTGGNYGYHLHFGIVRGTSSLGSSALSLESKGWLTGSGEQGRILNNPSQSNWNGNYAGAPKGSSAVLPPLKAHMGSVTYTFDANQVTVLAGNSAISNPWIKVSKSGLYVGESVQFIFGATNATYYTIGIDRDGERVYTGNVDSGYSYVCDKAGEYRAYVTCHHPEGGSNNVDSSYVYFTVYDNKPTNPWIQASKSSLFLGESISFTFGAGNATSYSVTVKHLDKVIKTEDNVKSGVTYTFAEEGTYTAYITAKNSSSSIDSAAVSFYIVNALDMGSYFVTKLNNPVSGLYIAVEPLTGSATKSNVYLSSQKNNNEWKFIQQDDLSYIIQNAQTGYYLSLADGKTDNGTNICCLSNHKDEWQRWYIRKNVSGYALVPKTKLSSVLSITGNGDIYQDCIFDGANISLFANDSVQSQRFVFEYTISPVNEWIKIDKNSLTSAEILKFDFGCEYAKGYTLHVDFRDGSTLETSIMPGGSLSFDKSGRCTAYVICELEDGTKITTETVTFYNMKIHDLGQSFTAKMQNTTSKYYLAAGEMKNGDYDVMVASESYCQNNVWEFTKQMDGSYEIKNKQTGYVLDLYDGIVEDKTNIVCSVDNNTDTQKWFITSNGSGYALAPKKDYTKYVSVFENDTIWWYGEHKDGANAVLFELDNVESQRFEFVEYSLNEEPTVDLDMGDLNNDTKINAKDALEVLKISVGKVNATDQQKVAADVNVDGDINAKDALEILKYAVNKPSVIKK